MLNITLSAFVAGLVALGMATHDSATPEMQVAECNASDPVCGYRDTSLIADCNPSDPVCGYRDTNLIASCNAGDPACDYRDTSFIV